MIRNYLKTVTALAVTLYLSQYETFAQSYGYGAPRGNEAKSVLYSFFANLRDIAPIIFLVGIMLGAILWAVFKMRDYAIMVLIATAVGAFGPYIIGFAWDFLSGGR
jgi:hypothetical protein